MLGCKNAVRSYRISAIEHMLDGAIRSHE
jgi:hypothetical protein